MNEILENSLWEYADGLIDPVEKVQLEKLISSDKLLQLKLNEIIKIKAILKSKTLFNDSGTLLEPSPDFTLKVLDAWQKESGIPMLEPVKKSNWMIWSIVGLFGFFLLSAIGMVVYFCQSGGGAIQSNHFINQGLQISSLMNSRLLSRVVLIVEGFMVLGCTELIMRQFKKQLKEAI